MPDTSLELKRSASVETKAENDFTSLSAISIACKASLFSRLLPSPIIFACGKMSSILFLISDWKPFITDITVTIAATPIAIPRTLNVEINDIVMVPVFALRKAKRVLNS